MLKKITRKFSGNNNFGGSGSRAPVAGGQRGFGGGVPNTAAILSRFFKKKAI